MRRGLGHVGGAMGFASHISAQDKHLQKLTLDYNKTLGEVTPARDSNAHPTVLSSRLHPVTQ